MCGIAGIFQFDGRAADRKVGQRMNDALSHRGPDGGDLWQEDEILLAHRRLAIRDLSTAGQQPMFSANGRIVISYNGEIYNDHALAARLNKETGFVRRTSCDAEIIPEAYLAWGEDAFEYFEGMFAIALWDREKRKLILARDSVGIKPLFYFQNSQFLCFASEIKGLLTHPMLPRKLSATDIVQMLGSGYTAPNRSLLENVRQVDPGSIVSIDKSGLAQRNFWQPSRRGKITDLAHAASELVTNLREVVRDQLISDVPVGVLQSGGIDSSLISLSLPSNREAPLFSVRFDERSHDETPFIDEIAKLSGRRVTWVDLPKGQDAEQSFRKVVHAVDGQIADSSALAALQLSEVTRQYVKVVLSGDGGDEFFGGYDTYRATSMASSIQRMLPQSAWQAFARAARSASGQSESRIPPGEKLSRFLYGLGQKVPHTAWRHYLTEDRRSSLYGAALRDQLDIDPLCCYSTAFRDATGDLLDRALVADQRHYLPADMLTKTDRVSMSCGLEIRVPLLDRRIMDYARDLDHNILLDNRGSTKIVLRAALKLLGASQNVTRGRKRGFNVPMNKLLKGDLFGLGRMYLDRHADIFSPYLSPEAVRRLWRDHARQRIDEKYVIWTLLTLAIWRESSGV